MLGFACGSPPTLYYRFCLELHLKTERLDAVANLGFQSPWRRSLRQPLILRNKIGQYLWPGMPAARIRKVDHSRRKT